MKVSGLDSEADWVFGKDKHSYKSGSDAIKQNVVTRLRSFYNDWFLDVDFGIPWLTLLGTRNNENQVKRAISKSILETTGIMNISKLEFVYTSDDRVLQVSVSYTDVYGTLTDENITI